MTYEVEITPHAGRQLKRLSPTIRRRADEVIRGLKTEPRPTGCIKLHAQENAWRVRIGDYRIIYEIYDVKLRVLVIRVDHRSVVYRD